MAQLTADITATAQLCKYVKNQFPFFTPFFLTFSSVLSVKYQAYYTALVCPMYVSCLLSYCANFENKIVYSTQVWTCGRHFYFFLTDGENWDKADSCSKPNANHIHIHDYGWELFYQQWMHWQRAYSLKVCGDFSFSPLISYFAKKKN